MTSGTDGLLRLAEAAGLRYRHARPTGPDGRTFVFFNALTGDLAAWDDVVGAALRQAGHGTLAWNYRGQEGSPFAAATEIDAALIVDDAGRLLAGLAPERPLLVGLSIGGLFAARALLAGSPADGLVLVNTLRRDGPRLRWINDALVRCAETGGLELLRDLFAPLLFNGDWLAANRAAFLGDAGYRPLDSDSGAFRLLSAGGTADWDLPYESLRLPVLVISGLQDHVFFEAADVAALAARLPDGRRIDMPDAGHMIPAERPEALAGHLLAWAAEI